MSVEKFHTPTVESNVPTNESLDTNLYASFEKLFFEDYEYLGGSAKLREKQKKSFFENEIENPTLDYPSLEDFDFETRESELLALKESALAHSDPVVAQAYRWRINEQIAQVRMLRATKEGNDRRFGRYSRFIYGAPSEEIFQYDLSKLKETIDTARASGDEERIQASEWLLSHVDLSGLGEIKKAQLPKKEKDTSEKLNVEQVQALFEEVITTMNLSDWKVVVDKNRKSASVSQEHKTVHLPKNISKTKKEIEALMAHELGTHVRRRKNGERSKLMLLGLGLDRYVRGEEGVATYEQQKVLGADEYAGFLGHFAGSLAHGVDGTKRDFRGVFEVLKHYNIARLKTVTGEEREKKASEAGWNTCMRTFRGTTCSTPGIAFTRDIVYREGNVDVYELVNAEDKEVHRFMVGKYDPANERHVWVLDQLGITEDDLERLENEGGLADEV